MTDLDKLEARLRKGPVRILCDEIGFRFDPRLEREDLFIAFVGCLVEEIARQRETQAAIAPYTGTSPSEASERGINIARSMVALDLGLSMKARKEVASAIHDLSYEANPEDDPTHPCDHLVDMLASCASAIRFGLEEPCRSRHAAEASNHVWKQIYGVTRFDSNTPSWQHEWARTKLQQAMISLLPARAAHTGEG
ncbi:MAG: hypothetical protein K5831_01160 [Brevundimonas sp.]|uniref:hypothetical protein n=1 Tax=Brevundimonas sp. TaxID=1871086 RepID=UPI002585392B|nr:hypothetical protein [Brevundimonas sp.]MCV0413477.1 hypothetical protein [Brevundimonas sp.]